MTKIKNNQELKQDPEMFKNNLQIKKIKMQTKKTKETLIYKRVSEIRH